MPILVHKVTALRGVDSGEKHTSAPKVDNGFSLLEMLVVLSIMAVALSVVGAGMMRSVEATRFDRNADAAVASLLSLRADAMLAGQSRVVIPDGALAVDREDYAPQSQRRLALPDGWRVDGDTIKISPTGICTGGRLRLYSGTGQFRDYILTPPKCAASRAVMGQ